MISKDAFAQEVRTLTDTAFAVSYLILGNSADCEDAMSEAVLRAYEGRGKLKKRDSFRAWFLQILRHEAYNVLHRRKRVQPVEHSCRRIRPRKGTMPGSWTFARPCRSSTRTSGRPCSCSRKGTTSPRSA